MLGICYNYIQNVYEMFLVGTSQVHGTVTFIIYMKCIWWEYTREMDLVPSMFLTYSHLFPEALTPSVD